MKVTRHSSSILGEAWGEVVGLEEGSRVVVRCCLPVGWGPSKTGVPNSSPGRIENHIGIGSIQV